MAKDKRVTSLDKAVLQAMGDGRSVGRPDDPAQTTWPELWSWLSTIYIGKDNMKQPATLSVQLGPDGVLVKLVDRDLCCSVNVSCSHLQNVFDELEKVLTSATLPVTTWGKREPQLRKRRIKG